MIDTVTWMILTVPYTSLEHSATHSHHYNHHHTLTGMPMVIYSQILMWGQSTCCLLALCVLNAFGCQIPKLFAAMVPLGLEAGADIVVKPIEGTTRGERDT